METIKQHPFEKTLGAGPYKFVGCVTIQKPTEANPRDNYKNCYDAAGPRFKAGMGTCAHCGMAIMNVFFVEIGNGDVYGVGCDCIGKVGLPAVEMKKVEKAEKSRQKELRRVRKENKVVNARAELEEILYGKRAALESLPHPSKFADRSLLDYALWIRDHVTNTCNAVVTIKKALKDASL